ncbi:hypothetical protein ES705_43733 [subsurface metagenome]
MEINDLKELFDKYNITGEDRIKITNIIVDITYKKLKRRKK